MTDPLLELEMRRRLAEVVARYPGLHTRELARQLDTSVALVEYHLAVLLEAGLVREERDGRYQRIFTSAGLGERERAWLGLLRRPIPLSIVVHLLASGPQTHKQITQALQISKSKLSFHLRTLERGGLLSNADGLFQVPNGRAVTRLLLEHPPTREATDAFASLWQSFYDQSR